MDTFIALIGASSGGSFLAIASAANSRLRTTLKSAIAAAAVNFVVGSVTLTLLLVLGVFGRQNLELLSQVPWWGFIGGSLGATFVTLSTIVIPKLGLTTTTLAVVCSQMMLSLVIDQWGWFGVTPHPISISRVIAIVLLLAAVTLTQLDKQEIA